DGIRYFHVTGVQTCALPIFTSTGSATGTPATLPASTPSAPLDSSEPPLCALTSLVLSLVLPMPPSTAALLLIWIGVAPCGAMMLPDSAPPEPSVAESPPVLTSCVALLPLEVALPPMPPALLAIWIGST